MKRKNMKDTTMGAKEIEQTFTFNFSDDHVFPKDIIVTGRSHDRPLIFFPIAGELTTKMLRHISTFFSETADLIENDKDFKNE